MKQENNWNKVKDLCKKNSEMVAFGPYYSASFKSDVKHFMMILSRYKFVAKMLKYKERAKTLEIGCSEGMGGVIIEQETPLDTYVGIDLDCEAIKCAELLESEKVHFICGDFSEDNDFIKKRNFDNIFSLDVIEHISQELEDEFVGRMAELIKPDGTVIIGTPHINMTPYAGEASKLAHINLFDQKRLYKLMTKFFENVFIFNMNDEIVSTGFEPMTCYIFAVCAGLKNR